MSGVPSAASAVPGTLGALVAQARGRLDAPLSDHRPEWIVAYAAGVPDAAMGPVLDRVADGGVADRVDALTAQVAAGEPVQYVLGRWPFRLLDLVVDPRVLIPRPETEGLVDLALRELRTGDGVGGGGGGGGDVIVADLGTGTGAVALSLAVEGPPTLVVWATDASVAALEVARTNLAALTSAAPRVGGRVRLAAGSWFGAFPTELAGRLRLVVSNPPYVAAGEWEALDAEVRDHEPVDALVPGPTGLEALEHLVDEAPRWLAPTGALILELAPHQAEPLARRARAAASFDEVVAAPDLTGRARYLVARRSRG
jgi:release factor glutamine methyltransferase